MKIKWITLKDTSGSKITIRIDTITSVSETMDADVCVVYTMDHRNHFVNIPYTRLMDVIGIALKSEETIEMPEPEFEM